MKPFISHPNEKINIVNKKDRIIGVKSRREVHKKNLLHREVAVMVFNKDKELLLSKLTKSNLWDVSCGGHLNAGESYLKAAKDEVKEELGLKNVKLKRLFKHYTDDPCFNPTNNRFIQVYKLVLSDGKLKMGKELKKLKFFNVKELKKMNKNQFSSRFLEIFKRMRL